MTLAGQTLLKGCWNVPAAATPPLLLIRSSSRGGTPLLAGPKASTVGLELMVRGDVVDRCPVCTSETAPLGVELQRGRWATATYACRPCGQVWQRPWPCDPAPDDAKIDTIRKHPAPEVRSRLATGAETPRTVRSLVKSGNEFGWTCQVTYARGTTTDQHGAPTRVVDSVVLRMTRDSASAVGCWEDGGFRVAWVSDPTSVSEDGLSMTRVGARDLASWVKRPASEVAA